MKIERFNSFNIINEDVENKNTYKPTNLIEELCCSMILLNNSFLDNILDKGQVGRYKTNTDVFVNDLKTLLHKKNRLCLGKFENNRCVEDTEIGKLTKLFDNLEFNIEDDFSILTNSRIAARNIIDKFPGEKLKEEMIKYIFWLGPNKTEEFDEDIVIELEDGRQFSFFLNKNLTLYKTASFVKFIDELVPNISEKIFSPQYIIHWNHLTQFFLSTIYKHANKNIQRHIEKFIDPLKIDNILFFTYLDTKHRDPRYKNLGEYIRELDDNFLDLKHLMSAIWKNREICFASPDEIFELWEKEKILVLNSKILEHLLTEGLTKNSSGDIEKLPDGFKLAKGRVKMKLIKTIVDKLGCCDRNVFYLGNNGNNLIYLPTLKFFREGFSDLQIKFDYHVHLNVKKEERKNDFQIKIIVELEDKKLMEAFVSVAFSRAGEMCSASLSARYKFDFEPDFNERIFEKMKIPSENE